MSLKNDFMDLGYEFARIIKKKIDEIEINKKKIIKTIKEETELQIRKDLIQIEDQIIEKKLSELNVHESERISEINHIVAKKKFECIENFIEDFKKDIRIRISENPQKYFISISSEMLKILQIIDKPVQVHFNSIDLKYLEKNPFFNPIPKESGYLSLSDNPIDIVSGFKITADDNSFAVDFSLEKKIEKYKNMISMKFMEIFPIFEVNVKNAKEIDIIQHSGAKRHATD